MVASKVAAAASAATAATTSGVYMEISSDNIKGLVLALSFSFFIVKKNGLKKAGASQPQA